MKLSLISFLRPYRKQYFFGILSVMLLDGIEMLPALAIKDLMDKTKEQHQEHSILSYTLFIFACYLAIALLRFSWRYFIILSSRDIEIEMKHRFFDKLLFGRYQVLKNLAPGDAVSLIGQDISNFRMFLGPGILVFFDMVAYLTFIPIVLYQTIGNYAFIIMAPSLLIALGIIFLRRPMNQVHEKISELQGKVSNHIYEETVGAKVFKVLNIGEHRRQKFTTLIERMNSEGKKINWYEMSFESLIQLSVFLSYLLLFYAFYQTLFHQGVAGPLQVAISVGMIAISVQLLDKLVWPMMAFSYIMNFYQMAKASMKRLEKEIEHIPPYEEMGKEKIDSFDSLEFKQVNFTFDEANKPLFHHLNWTVKRGEKVALVGHVGSGKSTLLKLIAGLYDKNDWQGEILFNGLPRERYERQSLSQLISYIPQSGHLFQRSYLRNLSPIDNVEWKRVEAATTRAHFVRDLNKMEKGAHSLIGEKGVNLSGGQKGRVGMARSFYSKRNLFLWDDTVAGLDSKTGNRLLSDLLKDQDITVILATHRLSFAENFDKIYLISESGISELNYPELSQVFSAPGILLEAP